MFFFNVNMLPSELLDDCISIRVSTTLPLRLGIVYIQCVHEFGFSPSDEHVGRGSSWSMVREFWRGWWTGRLDPDWGSGLVAVLPAGSAPSHGLRLC